jgi:hypothetical protein
MAYLMTLLDRVGTADIVAMLFSLVSCYMFITTGDIPDTLLVLTTTIVGFFFGKRQGEQVQASTIAALNPKPQPPLIGNEQ